MKIPVLLLVAFVASLPALAAQTATVVINRSGGTALTGATGVRGFWMTGQPPVDAAGIPTALGAGSTKFAEVAGNNPTTLTAVGVPLQKVWFTWAPFNIRGQGAYMRAIMVDLAAFAPPGPLDGTLTTGTISVTINMVEGAVVNVAVADGPTLKVTQQ